MYYTENAYLAPRIKLVRNLIAIDAAVMASNIGIPLERYQQVEFGRITAIPYFDNFSSFFGETLATAIFCVNWSLYSGERLRTYLGHFGYAHPRAAVVDMRISISTLNRLLVRDNDETILYRYQPAIDGMFGERIKDPEVRFTFAIGKNSEYRYVAQYNQWILILGKYYVSKNKPRDTEQDADYLLQEAIALDEKIRRIRQNMAKHYPDEELLIAELKKHDEEFRLRNAIAD